MRTLHADIETNIAKPITSPVWLVKLGYSTPVRLTSGRAITIADGTFNRSGLRVISMTDTTLRIALRDDDNAIKGLIDGEGIDDISVTVWQYYETEGVEVWVGFTDGARMKNHEVELGAARVRQMAATFPNRIFTRDEFPHLPTEGRVIKWGGVEITLRSR